jgi:tetratricopeptide (TPR) repeat protein
MTAGVPVEAQAMEAFRQGDFEAAAGGFASARESYRAEGDRLKAAEMANNLCVALLRLGRPQEALAAVEGTPETFAAEGETLRQAQGLGNLATALEGCGVLDRAEQIYLQAIELFDRLPEAAEARAQTLRALSQIQLRRGRPLEAAATLQTSLAGARPSLRQRILNFLLQLPSRLLGR